MPVQRERFQFHLALDGTRRDLLLFRTGEGRRQGGSCGQPGGAPAHRGGRHSSFRTRFGADSRRGRSRAGFFLPGEAVAKRVSFEGLQLPQAQLGDLRAQPCRFEGLGGDVSIRGAFQDSGGRKGPGQDSKRGSSLPRKGVLRNEHPSGHVPRLYFHPGKSRSERFQPGVSGHRGVSQRGSVRREDPRDRPGHGGGRRTGVFQPVCGHRCGRSVPSRQNCPQAAIFRDDERARGLLRRRQVRGPGRTGPIQGRASFRPERTRPGKSLPMGPYGPALCRRQLRHAFSVAQGRGSPVDFHRRGPGPSHHFLGRSKSSYHEPGDPRKPDAGKNRDCGRQRNHHGGHPRQPAGVSF